MYKKLLKYSLLISSLTYAYADNELLAKDKSANSCRCLPSQSCWPTKQQWTEFANSLKGRLIQPSTSLDKCKSDINSEKCKTSVAKVKNPFYLQSDPGRNESQGWYGAWSNKASTYAVEAANTNDVVKAVNFAREHNLR